MSDKEDRIEFDYPPVDMTFFENDSRQQRIPKPLVMKIHNGARWLELQIKKIEKDASIS